MLNLSSNTTWIYCSPSNALSSLLLCSVHHGCWTAGLPLRSKLLTGQVLLRGLWHLLRWRVPDRLGLHAGYCRSHAHRLLALFCQIRAEGAAVPHPFAHAVIVDTMSCFFPSWPLSLTWTWCHGEIPASRFLKAMLFRKPHSVMTEAQQQTLSSCICYVINSNSVHSNGMFYVTIIICSTMVFCSLTYLFSLCQF